MGNGDDPSERHVGPLAFKSPFDKPQRYGKRSNPDQTVENQNGKKTKPCVKRKRKVDQRSPRNR
jgi:hypothetical protein